MKSAALQLPGKIHYNYKDFYPFDLEKELRQFVLEGEIDQAERTAERFLNELAEHVDSLKVLKCWVLELWMLLVRKCFQMGIDVDDMVSSTMDNAELLNNFKTIEEIKIFQQGFVRRLAKRVKLQHARRKIDVVLRAQNFIKSHYQKNLTLQDVAHVVGFSPCHFSRLFSQETGQTFQDYLTEVRVKEAKKLLVNHEWSLQEICNQVGYQDASYFIKVFKRVVGLTPRQFVTLQDK